MSTHTITYDLTSPGNGEMTCHAPADAPCHAVWDCDCESIYNYHVAFGVPHHYNTYDDGYTVRAHHVGRFDPSECAITVWHENSDEDVRGTVVVTVEPVWQGDYFEFRAGSARVDEDGAS
ncbi:MULTISPECIES: hypothetical protein [Brachybacterium]|uniref:Uncharacterized protein n=1 Tax=Brachybacterium kimchii TaxID=2942909 RepID=A0ABY4N9T6_9MICO|nr:MULTISPECIES: hypothetical protein [Brachybacterium]MCG7309719.1 hypothetical protein [Brachybacterium sp. ACRRE]UQN30566.1 hypothetical protein M4486_04435 [Brachybacterium kimchii]